MSCALKTPNGTASPGSVVSVHPGYEASASSTAAAENARPTRPWSLSRRWAVSSALACWVLGASGRSTRARSNSSPSAPTASVSWARTSAAFASMSSPVRTKVIELRKPPSRFTPTLRVGGGGVPRAPATVTRSGPESVELQRVQL